MKYLNLTLLALLFNVIAHAQYVPTIVGVTSICTGVSTIYEDATSGGVWACTPASAGSLDPVTGYFTALSGTTATTGTNATISYTLYGTTRTLDILIRTSPPPLTGGSTICSGGTTTLADAFPGGGWESENTAVMTVSSSGVVYSVSPGTALIVYYTPDACGADRVITTVPPPVPYPIAGGGAMCMGGLGSHITLAGSDAGVTYQLYGAGTTIGLPVAGTGTALDMGLMTAPGSYTAVGTTAGGCATNMIGTAVITTLPLPAMFSLTGTTACGGSTEMMLDGSDPGVNYQLVNGTTPVGSAMAGTGSPLSFGAMTIAGTYTVVGDDASTTCTNNMTGSATITGNKVYGNITYTGGSSSDVFKVWLIQYNPADSLITALDSTTTCMSSGTPYYEFDGATAGNYMVKAGLEGATPGTSGWIPTYSLSAPHWDLAATVAHTTGADAMPVTMLSGTVPSGPGFISGNVVFGAGRGTDAGVANMLIYLKNASGNIVTYTYTNASGDFSFASLANGDYTVYPEAYKYYTVPAPVTLGTATESATGINFKQHTTSGTITPNIPIEGVKPVTIANAISVYPNPASNTLNIGWQDQPTGSAVVVITDVTGRVVYNAAIAMSTTTGQAKADITALQDGIYLITIKSAGISYNGKIAVQH